jgi:uncharacterized protein
LLRYLGTIVLVVCSLFAFAGDGDFPAKPNPPRLVNDFAGMMNAEEVARLEAKLLEYEKTSSTQITVVTIKNLGGYEVAQYAIELGNRWGVGHKGKDNGVVILASKDDRKVNISTGYGLEGALTDITSGRIIRNEIVPEFKNGNFYKGFDKAADAIIAATKGEYKAEEDYHHGKKKVPAIVTIFIILGIILIIWAISKGGGGGGGGYMSGRGAGDIATGMLLGHLLGGGRHSGGGFGGGFGGGGSGGFGGFGGGSFGGGGASGSW